MSENWFQELFINEAKPALDRHSGGGGSGGSAAVELAGGWKGTPVIGTWDGVSDFTQDQLVEKIYFNTELSVDEVVETLSKLEYGDFQGGSTILAFFGENRNNDPTPFKTVVVYNINGEYVFVDGSGGTILFSSAADAGSSVGITAGFVGWNPDFNGVLEANIPLQGQGQVESTTGLTIDTQQAQYAHIISLTPFEKVTGASKELSGTYDGSPVTVTENGTVDIGSLLDQGKLPLRIMVDVVAQTPDEPVLAAGLYQTGAIDLYNEQGAQAISGMLITSWDDMVANGEIMISNGVAMPGVKLPDNMPEKNEYGFYFGVLYVCPEMDAGIKFFEDGSIDMCDSRGNVFQSAPSNSVSYGQNFSDMSTLNMGIANFSEEGTGVSLDGMSFVLGEGVRLVGDLIMSNVGANGVNFIHQQSLTGITISDSVTAIGDSAFQECTTLTSVVIPNSVTAIGSFAFQHCDSLTNINIPNSVTAIGEYAFSFCDNLTSLVIPDSVITLGDSVVQSSPRLTSVEIGKGVTSLSRQMFYECTTLTSVVIPNSVTSIGSSAFNGCTTLTSVVIPNSVTSIGSSIFDGCTALTSVVIPNSVTSIGVFAFRGCTALTSVVISNSVTSIGDYAFNGCTALTSVVIPNSVTSIGSSAFKGCTTLTSVVISNSVTEISSETFPGCTALTSVVIPNSVTSISASAFRGCDNLTDVYYTGTEEQWSAISISYDNGSLTNATIHYNYVPET